MLKKYNFPKHFNDFFYEEILVRLGWKDYDIEGELPEGIEVRPYYWGDCTCGWDDVILNFNEDHCADCYSTKLYALKKQFKTQKEEYERHRDELCDEYGLHRLYGCESHCTCDYNERWQTWFNNSKLGEEGCADNCPVVLPNFYFKPLDLKIYWYKYPMRSVESNKPVTKEMLIQISDYISDCGFAPVFEDTD